MKKNVLIVSVMLLFIGCSEKEPTPKTPAKDKVDIRTSSAEGSVPDDFVPEHIRRSNIEVVKRY